MRRRGLHTLVRRRVLDEGCLYVGQSAGAIIAGPTIRTAHWKGWDDPAAGGALEGVEWTDEAMQAVGLVPDRAFFPHYVESEHAALVASRAGECGDGVEVVCLTDDGETAYVSGEEADDGRGGTGASA